MSADMEQLAKDLQTLLGGLVSCPVYEREAPRDKTGALTVKPPFLVYTADPQAPMDEAGVYTLDLFLDMWALNNWGACYEPMKAIDAALDARVHVVNAGTLCTDQSGAIMQRMERDPEDERIRRMYSQYAVRYYPNN